MLPNKSDRYYGLLRRNIITMRYVPGSIGRHVTTDTGSYLHSSTTTIPAVSGKSVQYPLGSHATDLDLLGKL